MAGISYAASGRFNPEAEMQRHPVAEVSDWNGSGRWRAPAAKWMEERLHGQLKTARRGYWVRKKSGGVSRADGSSRGRVCKECLGNETARAAIRWRSAIHKGWRRAGSAWMSAAGCGCVRARPCAGLRPECGNGAAGAAMQARRTWWRWRGWKASCGARRKIAKRLGISARIGRWWSICAGSWTAACRPGCG